MFTKESIEEVIEECYLTMERFEDENAERLFGNRRIRIHLNAIDGGGLSTYGKSVVITDADEYECRNGYLFIRGKHRDYNRDHSRHELREKARFIAYESIVSVECERAAVTTRD